MPHSLIAGITESGKTTLAKKFATLSKQQARGVIVLDPMYDQWDCDYQTTNVDEFLEAFWNSKCCDVFIDESGDMIGHYDKAMIQTATKGRHWGHNVYFITQRPAQISPTVRTQCTNLFLFAMAREDSETLAREWNKPGLREAALLPKGQCYMASRFGELKLINAFA